MESGRCPVGRKAREGEDGLGDVRGRALCVWVKGAPSVRGRVGAATEGVGMFLGFGLRSGVWVVVQLCQHTTSSRSLVEVPGLDSAKHPYSCNNRRHKKRAWALKFWRDRCRQGLKLCGKTLAYLLRGFWRKACFI